MPVFNTDSAYHYIQTQVDFGPRYISSKGWENCGDYLVRELKKYTTYVQEQNTDYTTYDGKNHVLRNIIAEFSSENKSHHVVCPLGYAACVADHDTINTNQPILGANDGGSGVGVLLEIARQLALKNSSIGVDIILFDAEDYGQPGQFPKPTPTRHMVYWLSILE